MINLVSFDLSDRILESRLRPDLEVDQNGVWGGDPRLCVCGGVTRLGGRGGYGAVRSGAGCAGKTCNVDSDCGTVSDWYCDHSTATQQTINALDCDEVDPISGICPDSTVGRFFQNYSDRRSIDW